MGPHTYVGTVWSRLLVQVGCSCCARGNQTLIAWIAVMQAQATHRKRFSTTPTTPHLVAVVNAMKYGSCKQAVGHTKIGMDAHKLMW